MDSRNIVLIGFMGTGKSSVGKFIAQKLKRPLIDVDRHIETVQKKKIAELFEKNGEAYFRALEKKAIAEFSSLRGAVITTGGGAVLDPDNLEALKRHGWVVALLASPETIYDRVRSSRHRPLLPKHDRLSEICRLLEARRSAYEKADLSFATDGKTPLQVANEIIQQLERKTGSASSS